MCVCWPIHDPLQDGCQKVETNLGHSSCRASIIFELLRYVLPISQVGKIWTKEDLFGGVRVLSGTHHKIFRDALAFGFQRFFCSENYVVQLGIIIPSSRFMGTFKSPTRDRKGRRNSPKRVRLAHGICSLWKLFFNIFFHALWTTWGIDNGSSRIKSHLKAVLSAGRCWTMLADAGSA